MFKTSFAAAALAALAAARGTDTGVGYDNAKTITFVTPSDDWGLTMHMYNSQAAAPGIALYRSSAAVKTCNPSIGMRARRRAARRRIKLANRSVSERALKPSHPR